MKKTILQIKINRIKVRDEEHFKAQLLYPKRVSEDKSKYNRNREKAQTRKALGEI